ncbi:MAG: PAS domain S-box protein [Proteobacteria bacterium]|nr:PAS domain S-box protein [Pseudomonadota bacterium]
MMFKSLVGKVFWLFFPLAVISIIFGAVVYHGQATIQQSNAKINLLKDFQLQLKLLETLHPHAVHLKEFRYRENFEGEIAKTEAMAKSLVQVHDDISPDFRERLEKIPFFMGNFSRAYLELFDLYILDTQLPEKNVRLLEALHKETDIPGVIDNPANIHHVKDLLQEMMVLQVGIYHNRQITALPKLKKNIAAITANSKNPAIQALTEEFGANIEANYINYLGIVNREEFLASTAKRFFEVATDTIAAVSQESKKTQTHFIWTIFSFTLVVICVNLLSWRWASLYIRGFLKNQQQAMTALAQGNYEFSLPAVPEDEVGDLTRALQTLAGNLKASLGKLTSSEKKYRDLVDNLSDWVWEIDENGRYIYASGVVQELLGYTSEEILGKSPFDLMSDEEAVRVGRIFSEFFLQRQSFSGLKNSNLHRDGHEVILETSGRPIFDEEGVFRGYRGIDRDVTAREMAMQEQARLEEKLYQAQKLESIGRLAGGVSHDFNNILSAINGYAELVLFKMAPDAPFRQEVSTILESGQRAARLTQQLLAFSRKQIIKQEKLDINKEVNNLYKMLRHLISEDVEIKIFYGEDVWPVNVDRSQLEQVIINLAVNARDAMPGGGQLTIETANVVLDDVYSKKHIDIEAGNYVMLAVTDNGQGMTEEVQENIFEPFFTTKEQSKGTGLGLATVYGIVKQNGGVINVYSEPGQGTIFKIYLPKTEGGSSEKEAPRSPQSLSAGGTETILLVEDSDLVRRLCCDVLTSQGYTVIEAQDGVEALDVYQGYQAHIDLLLTDVVMPKMNGRELAEKIKKINPGIHVLYMSGYTENAIVQNGILKNGINFVHKPISPQLLSDTIRILLDS